MRDKNLNSFISIFLAVLLVFITIYSVFDSRVDKSLLSNERVRELKVENDGHYVEYLTDIDGQEYKVVENISQDAKTVESKFYLKLNNDFILVDKRVQQISEDAESYTIQYLMNRSEPVEYEIEKPSYVDTIDM